MPGRTVPLVSGETYHIVNRGIARQPIFRNVKDYKRFHRSMCFYQNKNLPSSFSRFLLLSIIERNKILIDLEKQKNHTVELISYCLMPNHFHLLLQQLEDNGISQYIGNLTNSYTRYFNKKHERIGPLFQGKFKAVRIEDDKQLLHVVRYIHLNPYSSYIVKSLKNVTTYPFSSLSEYLKLEKTKIVDKNVVLGQFRTLESFEEFTLDQADYQRKLENIKHLTLEN